MPSNVYKTVLVAWLLILVSFAGVVRLPDVPKKLQPLKPVVRKPLESVVRYLGKRRGKQAYGDLRVSASLTYKMLL